MSSAEIDGPALARSWADHLREGGSTPWPRWVRDAGVTGGPGKAGSKVTGGRAVPGAAQLELLRRLNALSPVPHLAEHVLGRPGPGRGPVHLELPVDPLGRPAPRREVLRVAAGVLADLTAELPSIRTGRRRRRRATRPRPVAGLPAFVLEGPPVTVAEVRARLAASGLVEHRPRSGWLGARRDTGPELAVVLVAPLDQALREAWTSRVQRGAGRAWPRFVTQWAGRGSLPPSAAVHRTVDYWASRLGTGNVHLVTLAPAAPATDPAPDPAARVAELLGHPLVATQGEPDVAPGDPVRLGPAVTDVLRRVNVVLPFVCPQADRPPRRTALVALARDLAVEGEPLDLPRRRRPWAERTARAIVEGLVESGCARREDLGGLRSIPPATGRRLGGGEVLDAMIRMIHRVDVELAGGRRDGRGGR